MSSSSVKSGANLITAPKATSSSSLNKEANQSDKIIKSNSKEEEICDDWEQLDQQKIEKSLKSIKINNRLNEDEDKVTKIENNINMPPFTFFNNQVPQQTIKILKRPPSDKKLTDMANPNQNNSLASQPIKTFEQREQEYAQARLRILGSAHPEEETTTNSTTSNSTTFQNMPYNNSSSNNLNNLNQTNRSNLNIVREPIGPDDTKNFNGSSNRACFSK